MVLESAIVPYFKINKIFLKKVVDFKNEIKYNPLTVKRGTV